MIYPGVRIENASFPLTIPANQAGICSCLGNGDIPIGILHQNSQNDASNFWNQTFDLKKMSKIPDGASLYDPLIEGQISIPERLKKLCKLSISDRSGFPVSALLETQDGFIPGVNIEFEQWNFGLCAERVALSRAKAAGYNKTKAIHIYAPESDYISPCGSCRQVLFELMPDGEVHLYHDEESISRHFVTHLLPNGFTSISLKK